jgi:hypothetical protein
MKVVCSLCKHESGGFCTKKGMSNKPPKISVNKRRVCHLYDEDARKVLTEYRKKESHLKNLEHLNFMRKKALKDHLRKNILEKINTDLSSGVENKDVKIDIKPEGDSDSE